MSAGWTYFLDFKNEAFELSDGELTVGRSRVCDITIDDPSVSRRHVVLKADSGRILLQDLGSSNGTFVNGVKVEASAELHHGDALGLGDADVSVRVIGMSAFETVRMDALPAPGHGDATLFLQEASAKLAQEAISHEADAPLAFAPPEGAPLTFAGGPSHMAPPPVTAPAPPPVAVPAPPQAVAPPPPPVESEPVNHMAPPPVTAAAPPPVAAPAPPKAVASPRSPEPPTAPLIHPPAFSPPADSPAAPPPAAPRAGVPSTVAPSAAQPAAPVLPVIPAASAAVQAAGDVRLDQNTGELLPSLDGFDSTMGPEMLEAIRMEAAENPPPPTATAQNPYSNPYSSPAPTAATAGFGIRFLAFCIDWVWMTAATAGAYFFGGQEVGAIVGAGLSFVVMLFGWAIWGTTPGKRVCKLYLSVGAANHAGIGFPRALARIFGYLVSTVTLGIGFLMIAFSKSKRGLHDLIAGTEVRRQA